MKNIFLFIGFMLAICEVQAQRISTASFEEVFYNQKTRWNNNFQDFDVNNIRLLSMNHLYNLRKEKIRNTNEWQQYLFDNEDLLFFNASKSKFIDLYSADFNIQREGQQYFANRSKSKNIFYGDVQDQSLTQLSFCDGDCAFDDVYWLDDDRVLILGYYTDTKDRFHPIKPGLIFLDFKEGKRYNYAVNGAYLKNGKTYENEKLKFIIFDKNKRAPQHPIQNSNNAIDDLLEE